jgi:hypothetical protein
MVSTQTVSTPSSAVAGTAAACGWCARTTRDLELRLGRGALDNAPVAESDAGEDGGVTRGGGQRPVLVHAPRRRLAASGTMSL